VDSDRFVIKFVPARADFERFRDPAAVSALEALLTARRATLVRVQVRPPHFVQMDVTADRAHSLSADFLAEIHTRLALTGPVVEYAGEDDDGGHRAAPGEGSLCAECGFLDGEHVPTCSNAR
jgi:hypothetical protein